MIYIPVKYPNFSAFSKVASVVPDFLHFSMNSCNSLLLLLKALDTSWSIEIAKNLISKGMKIDEIEEITGLSKEEIEKIK